MRTLLAPALGGLLAVLLLAGCLGQAPGVTQLSTAGRWTLDCSLGGASRIHDPAWLQDCIARASHTPGPKAEIFLAVNPTDPDNVVIGSKDNNPESSNYCVWNGLAVTHDGGKTWRDVVIGGKYFDRSPGSPYYGFSCNTDPDLAFSANGDVHYVVEMYNLLAPSASGPLGPDPTNHRALLTPGWLVVLATSHDGGDTWPDTVVEDFSEGVASIIDYHRTIVSPSSGAIVTALRATSGGPIAVSGAAYTMCHVLASRDGGKTADAPVLILGPEIPSRLTCEVIAAAPDGTIVVMGRPGTGVSGAAEEATVPWSIAWSTDDAHTFSTPQHAFDVHGIPGVFNGTNYRTGNDFELVYDLSQTPSRGTLYAIYAANDRGNADVYVRSSRDNGHTWGEQVRVNDDAGDHQQWLPNLAVAGDGSLHAFFMDKRWDPADLLIDIAHAASLDGGTHWSNQRVTNVSWDGDLGRHQERQSFIGDYLGAGSSGNVVWGAFPDASNGAAPVIAAARLVPNR